MYSKEVRRMNWYEAGFLLFLAAGLWGTYRVFYRRAGGPTYCVCCGKCTATGVCILTGKPVPDPGEKENKSS